ncbi:hypothetical protein QYF61_017795, partial [Mycteria americana]
MILKVFSNLYDSVILIQYLKGASKKAGEGLFTRACSDRTKCNGFKLRDGRLRLNIRNKFFTMRVMRHWNRLPREVVDAPSLEVFKARLDGALSNLAKQPQFPQLLLIRLVLYTLQQLHCPSLDTLQHLNIPLVVRGPKLNRVFEMQPHQCR